MISSPCPCRLDPLKWPSLPVPKFCCCCRAPLWHGRLKCWGGTDNGVHWHSGSDILYIRIVSEKNRSKKELPIEAILKPRSSLRPEALRNGNERDEDSEEKAQPWRIQVEKSTWSCDLLRVGSNDLRKFDININLDNDNNHLKPTSTNDASEYEGEPPSQHPDNKRGLETQMLLESPGFLQL